MTPTPVIDSRGSDQFGIGSGPVVATVLDMIAHHVTSSLNRSSIAMHGLDWRRMTLATGIAGSRVAEQEGCFLALNEHERDWFVRMNNTGGAVDVWEVSGVLFTRLVLSPQNYSYSPGVTPPDRIRLAHRDIPQGARGVSDGEAVTNS